MIERKFLGWDRPFLAEAVAWLLARRDELPRMLVVVPTAQSGRRLREAMAEAGGAILSPKMATPGSFLQARDEEAAADWIEQVAWVEVLESVDDWSEFEALFPKPPKDETNWAGGLAKEMVRLRHSLQENGLSIAIAAPKLSNSVENERWNALAALEQRVERCLADWDLNSRSQILSHGLRMPERISQIVLAGVAEMPPLVERAMASWSLPVVALIGAPESESAQFSQIGRPLPNWAKRPLSSASTSMQVVADPRQQAAEALKIVANAMSPSNEVAIGSADAEVGDELVRLFTHEGWVAFHPAATPVVGGLAHWCRLWSHWISEPTLAHLAALLELPETGILVSGKRAQKAKTLASLRDRWMVNTLENLKRRVAEGDFHYENEKAEADELCKAAVVLEGWRASMLDGQFKGTMKRLLEIIGQISPETEQVSNRMIDWLEQATPIIDMVKRGPGFWIDLMLSDLLTPPSRPPDGRVLDIQGWLELFHEPGSHLVLCGMNEGKIPARSGGEPWLSESSRERLGLIMDADRASRDAFLYHSMLESRRVGGRVDVICGKSAAGGEPLLPSRVLLACERDALPDRVELLFKEVEPPDAGLRWHDDFKWQIPSAEPPQKIGVTSLSDYLSCPFRYYLKHVQRMRSSDPTRSEWSARDFGNVAHEVLERWGADVDARNIPDAGSLHRRFAAELDRVVAEWFGKRVPLAIRIQKETLWHRFQWVAATQAKLHAEGWRTIDVERKIHLTFGESFITGKIDRIDRHHETGQLRVIDYKSGDVGGVIQAHRKKVSESSTLPSHLSRDCPAVYQDEEKGKPAEFLWHNLQLPLYALSLVEAGEPLPEPCYFTLGATESKVDLHRWDGFDMNDLTAAKSCTAWVVEQINHKVFMPPAEKVTYDDYAVLAAGRTLHEMIQS